MSASPPVPALHPPDPPLSDGAVALRPWTERDIPAIVAACQDPDIPRYTSVPSPYTTEDGAAFVARSTQRWAEGAGAAFAIVAVEDPDRVLGAVAVDLGAHIGTVGYWVASAARGQGVARRGLELLSSWVLGEAGVTLLLAEIRVGNEASIRVAEAAGFTRTGAIDLPQTPENPDILLFARRARGQRMVGGER